MTLELASTYLHVYKPNISTLWDSFASFFLWRVWEKLRSESTLSFFVKKEDLASSFASLPFQNKFSSEKTFPSSKTQLFIHYTFYPKSKHTSSKLENFSFIELPWDRPTNCRLHSHFHPKLMKDISSSIKTCFLMILLKNFNLWIHVPNLSFLVEISLLHMKLVIWPTWQVC